MDVSKRDNARGKQFFVSKFGETNIEKGSRDDDDDDDDDCDDQQRALAETRKE